MDGFSFPARAVFVVLVAGGVALSVLACGSDRAAKDVDVVNPRLVQTPNGQRGFTGTLVNQRPNTLSIAQIEVALYDDQGSSVETIRIEVKDVAAGDSVSFNKTIDSDQAFRQAQVQSVLTP
jgi:hypothetical protein